MIYINNNEKLANLLEKMLDPKNLTKAELVDAKDLIVELRSPRSEVNLVDDCESKYHHV